MCSVCGVLIADVAAVVGGVGDAVDDVGHMVRDRVEDVSQLIVAMDVSLIVRWTMMVPLLMPLLLLLLKLLLLCTYGDVVWAMVMQQHYALWTRFDGDELLSMMFGPGPCKPTLSEKETKAKSRREAIKTKLLLKERSLCSVT